MWSTKVNRGSHANWNKDSPEKVMKLLEARSFVHRPYLPESVIKDGSFKDIIHVQMGRRFPLETDPEDLLLMTTDFIQMDP